MKNFYSLICLFIAFGFTLNAQTFSVADTIKNCVGYHTGTDVYGTIRVYNNNTSGRQMKWRKHSVNIPSGWTISFCDPKECHPVGVDSAKFVLNVNTNMNDIVNCHFMHGGITGNGSAQMFLWDTVSMDSKIITWNAYVNALGVVENTSTIVVTAYPNPSQDIVSVSYKLSRSGVIDFVIFDLSGREINRYNQIEREGTISVTNLSKGSYIGSFFIDGKQVATTTFKKI